MTLSVGNDEVVLDDDEVVLDDFEVPLVPSEAHGQRQGPHFLPLEDPDVPYAVTRTVPPRKIMICSRI